ncbi:hypothetical protein TorRG33x02_333550 [Trema orientale]|uniref:Uncharacterized protein n=1 Tax=Trema orientale TaxID=63057 RepID=A0A2P5B429_TREOI|nr:hypothetical protein TorRG33x02_333550 [Trema orientale]
MTAVDPVPPGFNASVFPQAMQGVLELGLAKDSSSLFPVVSSSSVAACDAGLGYQFDSSLKHAPTLHAKDSFRPINPNAVAVQDQVFVHDSMLTAADPSMARPSKIAASTILGTSVDGARDSHMHTKPIINIF